MTGLYKQLVQTAVASSIHPIISAPVHTAADIRKKNLGFYKEVEENNSSLRVFFCTLHLLDIYGTALCQESTQMTVPGHSGGHRKGHRKYQD